MALVPLLFYLETHAVHALCSPLTPLLELARHLRHSDFLLTSLCLETQTQFPERPCWIFSDW